jgi:hypothetical protein
MKPDLPWPKSVRVAGYDDEAPLYDLLMALYKDNDVGIPPRPHDVREAIRSGTRRGAETGVLIAVADGEEGELAGSVCVVPATAWYNQSPEYGYLAERWLFVRPECRKGRTLHDDLFQAARCYKRQAENALGKRVPLISSVTSLKRLPAKMRLWRRYGALIGAIYEVDPVAQTAAAMLSRSAAA